MEHRRVPAGALEAWCNRIFPLLVQKKSLQLRDKSSSAIDHTSKNDKEAKMFEYKQNLEQALSLNTTQQQKILAITAKYEKCRVQLYRNRGILDSLQCALAFRWKLFHKAVKRLEATSSQRLDSHGARLALVSKTLNKFKQQLAIKFHERHQKDAQRQNENCRLDSLNRTLKKEQGSLYNRIFKLQRSQVVFQMQLQSLHKVKAEESQIQKKDHHNQQLKLEKLYTNEVQELQNKLTMLQTRCSALQRDLKEKEERYKSKENHLQAKQLTKASERTIE